MVTIWFIAISLRIRSLALTPIASERLRTVIGGSISTCDLRAIGDARPDGRRGLSCCRSGSVARHRRRRGGRRRGPAR